MAEHFEVPGGPWRDEMPAIQHVEDRGWVPAARESENAVYPAEQVHQLLKDLMTLLAAAENKFAAMQTYHSGPALASIEAMRAKLRDAPIRVNGL